MAGKEPYKVIDVFAGPGGLGEGFAAFGHDAEKPSFKLALSIEKDPTAHSTLLLRSFYRQFDPEKIPPEYWSYAKGEITKAELFDFYPQQAKAAAEEAQCIELGKTPAHEVKSLISQRLNGCEKWVLVGGPPCQAYSLVGRARMRSTNPDFEADERHFLYKEYLRIIADHRPPVFVMENVKGILSAQHSGKKIIQSILSDLRKPGVTVKGRSSGLGYRLFSLVDNKPPEKCEPEDFLVKAEKYGIPQARHRMLILGIREDIHITPKTLQESEATTVAQAIGDLPKIRSAVSKEPDTLELWREILDSITSKAWYRKGRGGSLAQTIEKIDTALVTIQKRELKAGAESMTYTGSPKIFPAWYRHGCDGVVTNHAGRGHMRSDLHRYLFVSAYAAANGKSIHLSDFPKTLLPAHQNVQEGVQNSHFSDRFRVQVRGRPSTTITSHISKDGHYFIHYDPSQCRSLTVREAARLQTFPDSYKFEGGRTSQYHQVGNAVPPLLSMQVAAIVHDILKRL
ncbi:MAG: DNA cytosine methyltransferase [Gallionella sp.]|nr:DNA cytosine methyltransferase [Gallionella sp.]